MQTEAIAEQTHGGAQVAEGRPACKCAPGGRRAQRYVCTRPGPHLGRYYFACVNRYSKDNSVTRCDFFCWAQQRATEKVATRAETTGARKTGAGVSADAGADGAQAARDGNGEARARAPPAARPSPAGPRAAHGEQAVLAEAAAPALYGSPAGSKKRPHSPARSGATTAARSAGEEGACPRPPEKRQRHEPPAGAAAANAAGKVSATAAGGTREADAAQPQHPAGVDCSSARASPCDGARIIGIGAAGASAPAPASAEGGGGAAGSPPPPFDDVVCRCGVPASTFVVGKEGPNKGRRFYSCGRGSHASASDRCRFFKWHEEEEQRRYDARAPASTEIAVHRQIYREGRRVLHWDRNAGHPERPEEPESASDGGDAGDSGDGHCNCAWARFASGSASTVTRRAAPVEERDAAPARAPAHPRGLPALHPALARREAAVRAFVRQARLRGWTATLAPPIEQVLHYVDVRICRGVCDEEDWRVRVEVAADDAAARDAGASPPAFWLQLCGARRGDSDAGWMVGHDACRIGGRADIVAFHLADGSAFVLTRRKGLWRFALDRGLLGAQPSRASLPTGAESHAGSGRDERAGANKGGDCGTRGRVREGGDGAENGGASESAEYASLEAVCEREAYMRRLNMGRLGGSPHEYRTLVSLDDLKCFAALVSRRTGSPSEIVLDVWAEDAGGCIAGASSLATGGRDALQRA